MNMTELTPIPVEQRHCYYDALVAGRAEAKRLGIPLIDDRIFLEFHRALYQPMLDAHEKALREQIAAEIEATIPEAHRYHKPTCQSCLTRLVYTEQHAAIARGGAR